MPSSQSTPRTQSKSTDTLGESTAKTSHRKASAYGGDFEQHLLDHGIYPNNRVQKPHNWHAIQDMIAQPRPSLSPSTFSDEAFELFQQANEEALTEAMVMRKPFRIISGDANISSASELPFGNLEPLTNGTLVDAKPDFYDGVQPTKIDRRIRQELSSHIIPSTQQQAPALPNFFLEAKGPHGDVIVSKRQACYDGALGARGMHSLRTYGAEDHEEAYDNNAYTITSTYHSGSGTLQLYATHPTQAANPESGPEYYMTQIKSFAMTGAAETFREGASALRNARDWTREQRDETIVAANDRLRDLPREVSGLESSDLSMLSQFTNDTIVLESETSADELALDENIILDEIPKRSKREAENRPETRPKRRLKKEASQH
ncbi:MAG: hypothetical protein M1817_003906 [Caeruleum heppii]|nr:MAG: hypothetical protein M1817_003906 [Caeruleum heppii]